MRYRSSIHAPGPLVLIVCLAGSAAAAQEQNPINNAFFGFDYLLGPLAVKWACGGQRDQDVSQIEMLIAAFPEDAARAELKPMVTALDALAAGPDSVPQVIGIDLDAQQIEHLCATALPLKIDWVTPERLILGDDSEIPVAQETAWGAFWSAMEDLQ